MSKLEDVMSEEQFNQSKILASKMLSGFKGEQYTTAQIMLAASMVVGGFIYKDVKTEALLDASAEFLSNLYRTGIRTFRKDNGLPFEDAPTPTMNVPTSTTVN